MSLSSRNCLPGTRVPPGASPTYRPPAWVVYTPTFAGSTSGRVKRASTTASASTSPASTSRFTASIARASVANPCRITERNPDAFAAGLIQWIGFRSPVSFANSQPAFAATRKNAISCASAGTVGRALAALGLVCRSGAGGAGGAPGGSGGRSGTNAFNVATTACGTLAVPVTMRVAIKARRPLSSTLSRRAATSSGSPAGSGACISMRQPALITRAIG